MHQRKLAQRSMPSFSSQPVASSSSIRPHSPVSVQPAATLAQDTGFLGSVLQSIETNEPSLHDFVMPGFQDEEDGTCSPDHLDILMSGELEGQMHESSRQRALHELTEQLEDTRLGEHLGLSSDSGGEDDRQEPSESSSVDDGECELSCFSSLTFFIKSCNQISRAY